jgi:hypothetical protein
VSGSDDTGRKPGRAYRGRMSRPAVLIAALGLLLLSACQSGTKGGDTAAAATSSGSESSTGAAQSKSSSADASPSPAITPTPGCEGAGVVDV